jgi:hypothetical protein
MGGGEGLKNMGEEKRASSKHENESKSSRERYRWRREKANEWQNP